MSREQRIERGSSGGGCRVTRDRGSSCGGCYVSAAGAITPVGEGGDILFAKWRGLVLLRA